MKMKRKQIGMLVFIAIIVILMVVTSQTPGTIADADSYQCKVYATILSLLPPVIAIGLALITKEVYTSLLAGIIVGGLLYSNFNLELMLNTILFQEEGGMIYKLSDAGNVGILVFLVMLGILVSLLNRAGGSAAFGKWASRHIKTRIGAQISVMILGVLIFVDDYFNCLTVGSVMRPVTDRYKVSRAKLAYIIDATAAPVCIIAPISSWAAAVNSYVPKGSSLTGFSLFLRTIPYNLYAILTLLMVLYLILTGFDFGLMKKHEINAERGDLFTSGEDALKEEKQEEVNEKGRVADLVLPVVLLIVSAIGAMIYTGYLGGATNVVAAFSGCDSERSLIFAGLVTILFCLIWYLPRKVLNFADFMESFVEGFRLMVPAMAILTFAWALKGIGDHLEISTFVKSVVGQNASASMFIPMLIFIIAIFLAFSTGTSWGTFAILVPIVIAMFPEQGHMEMMIISVSAVLAGAVCGDHVSPISDTTVMSSAGAQCNHMNHVSTQLPYAAVVAAVCVVGYILAAFIQIWWIVLLLSAAILLAVLTGMRIWLQKKA